MKKLLKILGIFLLIVLAYLFIGGLFISKKLDFERSITINASQQKVWDNVGSLGAMDKWSPWDDEDPAIKKTLTGPDGQPGAVATWNGNKTVGEGSQTIVKVDAPNRMDTKIHFIRPMESDAAAYVTVIPEGTGSKATWGFKSEMSYPFNALKPFLGIEGSMDKKFMTGLNELKAMCEK